MAQYWTFVNAGAVATGANPVPALPAGIQAGDLLVIVAGAAGTSYSSTPPTGWTNQQRQTVDPRFTVWFRQYDGAITAPTLTNAATSCAAVMLAYRNAPQRDVGSALTTGTSTSPATTNHVTTKQADELVLSLYVATSGSVDTWTADVATTARVNSGPSATIVGLLCCDENQAAAGASATRTATLVSTAVAWTALTLAFVSNALLNIEDGDALLQHWYDCDYEDEWRWWQFDSIAIEPLKSGQFFDTEVEM